MKSNQKPAYGNNKTSSGKIKKILVFFLFIFVLSFSALAPFKPTKAQIGVPLLLPTPVFDLPKTVWDKAQDTLKTLWQKGASLAFQQTLRSALNTMAYDTANWIGSGGEGQKPLFVTQDWGSYMAQIGDEAAGTFLENFTANWSATREDGTGMTMNFCQPSSIDVKLRIALGLSNQYRPRGPNCTATEMIGNWTSAAKKLADYKDPNFLNKFVNVFDPVSSDLGIYWQASTDMMQKQIKDKEVAKTTLLGKGGWLDPLTIDDKPISLPNQAELEIGNTYEKFAGNFGKYTGDAFVDAANIFLNQLAITSFNNLVQNIGKKTNTGFKISSLVDGFEADPNYSGGETALKENTSKLIQPNFGIKADYDILSELSICPDENNPGPSNCVIDNKFMQAISEQKTVADAIADGYINGSWRFETASLPGSYQNSYTWRNISILRKYRIVPASWELVFQKMEQYKQQAIDSASGAEDKNATLMDLVSCFSPYDEYNQFSSQFDSSDQAWCTGLVDPSWVLKAPLNYCKKEGVGSQIQNKYIVPAQQAYGDSPYVPSSITITRADNYCADNQTCVKEGSNGSCLSYGYCNEEKRTWSFSGDSCQPIDNTCQSYVNQNIAEEVSYLKNTLDFSGCSQDNAGCRQYAQYGNYNASLGTVSWLSDDAVYLNGRSESCTSENGGCSEFIRVKPSWGANLIMNSNFINDALGATSTSGYINDWPIEIPSGRAEIVESSISPGGGYGKALKLNGSGRAMLYSDIENSLLPSELSLIEGQGYTLSADVYLSQGSNITMALGQGAERSTSETRTTGSWRHLSVSKIAGDDFSTPSFSIAAYGNSAALYIKNIKFELSPYDTGFTAYGNSKTYLKLLPQYLENTCYEDSSSGANYQFRDDAPGVCYDYAKKCDASEAGCELYTSLSDNLAVPAQVSSNDYCAGECVGYDIYVARASQFNSANYENLIPSTAQSCSSEAVGCTEFTNLDDIDTGGENREYYSALKYCVKPGQSQCANFYAWEKTDAGSQLQLYTLEEGINGGPKTVSDDSSECNENIYNAPVNSPLYNPDCREFYSTSGEIFYHLNSKVITCSDDCRAYRMSGVNYDNSLSQAECSGADRNWNSQEGACAVCINGGNWSDTHGACMYQGIPGEGKSCRAVEAGCREYNGSNGNNVRLLASYDFETMASAWSSNCSSGITLADISSDKDGKSLLYNSGASACSAIGEKNQTLSKREPLIKRLFADDNVAAQLAVGSFVSQGKAYNVKFWAKSSTGSNLSIYFYNPDNNERSEFNATGTVSIKAGEWQLYSANLESLDHAPSGNEVLAISGDNDFYLDNFILTEITDRYYLIQSSSEIPDVCYYDIFDTFQGPDYNLGCSAYNDRNGVKHNLHNFSSICASESVGCEQVIATQNYTPYGSAVWNDENNNGVCDNNEDDCVEVPGDRAMYVTYDSSKQCLQQDLGCSLLGEALLGTSGGAYSDVYKKNNPNNYDDILCNQAGLGCQMWQNTGSSGYSYFRDPGSNTCVYRTGKSSPGGEKSWYKQTVKRCDADNDGSISGNEISGQVCYQNSDCNSGSCISDSNDYLCDISYLKTIGYGGLGNRVPIPSGSAGICSVQSSTCSEYIDPESKFNPDLFVTMENNRVTLKPNKLYVLTVKDKELSQSPSVSLDFSGTVAMLLNNNTFNTPSASVSIGGEVRAVLFNSLASSYADFNGSDADLIDVALREAAIEYQLESSVDKTTCNGLLDFDNGCVLFNERAVTGGNYSSLSGGFDPFVSKDGNSPIVCDEDISGSCSSNKLLKVTPDRTCATWYTCSTYAYDQASGQQVCYDLEQCNSLGDDGKCNNFLSSDYKPDPQNATGYYMLGKNSLSQMQEVGLNSNVHYSFEEIVPSLHCVRKQNINEPCSFDSNIVKDLIIREPDKAKVDYPAEGRSYLRVPSAYSVSPMAYNSFINLSSDQDYYLSYLVNTENSSGDAVIAIKPNDGKANTGITIKSSAPNGWERKIYKFNTENADYSQIMLYLSSDDPANEGEVYFDDINIEPVLQVSDGTYTSRDCRLYPNSDSLDCREYNKNVISEGLEGYCLEYDKDNRDNCLTWYPVDRISSSLGGTALGYNGVSGLSYCTNINSNIKFAKKVTTKFVFANDDKSGSGVFGGQGDAGAVEANSDYCGYLPSGGSNDQQACEYHCGDCDYYKALVVNDKDGTHNYENVYCVPNTESSKMLFTIGEAKSATLLPYATKEVPNTSTCNSTKFYSEAWMEYSGSLDQISVKLCEDNDKCENIDESVNADPPIRVYNPDYPAYDEQGLQYLSADSGDRDKVFNFSCSNFMQVVSSSGENKAWTGRIGTASNPDYAFETPDFFNDATTAELQKYGRQRNAVPYGSATFDANYDLLNSGPVYLQNQYYQKDNNDIYAGRPYGCTGSSCQYVGYCSENPNVMCLYYPTDGGANDYHYINVKTCSDGGFGICQPLWSVNVANGVNAENVISTIFKQSYGNFAFRDGNYLPGNTEENILPSGGNNPAVNFDSMYLNNQAYADLGDNKPSGVYSVKFNTIVDPEQQPLNMIYIEWGDGSSQAITGIDHRPTENNPHIFYHYYNNTPSGNLKIKIWDNWNRTAEINRGL